MKSATPRQFVTIVVRPQKAELLCRHLLDHQLIDDLTVAEQLGMSRGGGIPRAELSGIIDRDNVDALIELVAGLSRSSLAGDGKIFLYDVLREIAF